MPSHPPTYVLDANAVLAYLEDEPGARQVEELLLAAVGGQARLAIGVINLGEVWYNLARRYGAADADGWVARLKLAGVEVVEVDWELARAAATLKVRGQISYADCFAAALAQARHAAVVTRDREFKTVQDAVKVIWLKA